jgi:hypothetical protein
MGLGLYIPTPCRDETAPWMWQHLLQAIADPQTLIDLVAKLLDLQAIND